MVAAWPARATRRAEDRRQRPVERRTSGRAPGVPARAQGPRL